MTDDPLVGWGRSLKASRRFRSMSGAAILLALGSAVRATSLAAVSALLVSKRPRPRLSRR